MADKQTMAEESNSSMKSIPLKSTQAQVSLGSRVTVPIQRSDKSMFDNEFVSMKLKFANEMKRIESEMAQFSMDLGRLNEMTVINHSGVTSLEVDNVSTSRNAITKSPLIEEEGDNRTLNLQFDVSQFHPDEVTVRILNDVLTVTAVHQHKTDQTTMFSELHREFQLPRDTNPETVVSSIDKDGVLTVNVPLALEYTET